MSSLAANDVGPEGEGIALAGAPAFPIVVDSNLSPVVDTSPQIWSLCLTHADKFDKALVESWKGDMDGILIFSGLFSAIVTAFLIDSYKALQPDFATANTNLTAQIAFILARSTNQPDPVLPQMPSQNSRPAYLVINALWFLSLSFSLTSAITATLVQQWSRTYLQGTEEVFNPHQRARMRTYLQRGVQKFHLSELVDAIPMLIHVALFLFFGGLLVFLFNIDTTLAHIVLVLLIPALFIYLLLTALPVFFYDCPYKTPLTSVLSYLTYIASKYRPRSRRQRSKAAPNRWHPEKRTMHLTTLWSQDGSAEGAELDHSALRWTFVALTELSDLEQFVGALPGLLQSDSGTGFTHDGARAAQSLLFGPDMLANHLVPLLNSTVPSYAPAFGPIDHRRLDTRTVTCLNTVALIARACEGPTQAAPDLWSLWATTFANPVARAALALRDQQQIQPQLQQLQSDAPAATSALAALAQGTALLLAWRALIAYRAFLADIRQRAITAGNVPAVLYARFALELRTRLSAGHYLALALREVIHGLTGDRGSGVAGGALLAQRVDELLSGALHAYMPGGAGLGVGAGTGRIAEAALEDMGKAKACLCLLFMHAACSLPADTAGQETLRALAAPLAWPESCEYEETTAAKDLLSTVRHAHGPDTLTVFDEDKVVELYLSIHATPAHPH